jgi:hypothetical protein
LFSSFYRFLLVLRVEAFQWGIGVMIRAVPTEDTRIIACVNVAGFVCYGRFVI